LHEVPARRESVELPVADHPLPGILAVPTEPRGVVLFAHGSGSGRASARNGVVAQVLWQSGFATLLLDLLSDTEAAAGTFAFDIPLLAHRLCAAAAWLANRPDIGALPTGFAGSSTGAAAALLAAASPNRRVHAVVSRAGRLDLVDPWLPRVTVPTLLLVGDADPDVLRLNRVALSRLAGPRRLEIVPRATHLFEEPGTLESAAGLAASWFSEHLAG